MVYDTPEGDGMCGERPMHGLPLLQLLRNVSVHFVRAAIADLPTNGPGGP